MGNVTGNLSRLEFSCQCGCGLSDPHPMLVAGTQEAVDKLGARSVIVTSGSRCPVHNAAEGGASGSVHCPQEDHAWYTLAADLIFKGVPLWRVVERVQLIPRFSGGGIGLYLDRRPGGVDRVHVDVRSYTARWGKVDGSKVSWTFALSEMDRRRTP